MIALDNLQFIRTGDHHIVLCVGKSQMERGGVSLKNCSQYLEGKVYLGGLKRCIYALHHFCIVLVSTPILSATLPYISIFLRASSLPLITSHTALNLLSASRNLLYKVPLPFLFKICLIFRAYIVPK